MPRLRSATRAVLATFATLVATVVPVTPAAAATPLPERWTAPLGERVHHSSPTVADLDGDGEDEVLVGSLDGWVHARSARTGAARPGWPQPVTIEGGRPTAVESSPTVADLDRDGRPEVVVGAGSRWVPDQDGGLVVLRADGSLRCRFQTEDAYDVWDESVGARPDGYSEGIMSTPAVGDVDGDGWPDIVVGSWDLWIYVLDRDCRVTSRFWNDDSVWSSPALHDVDGDGRQEIFIGGDSTAGGPEDWAGGVFRSLDWRDGQLVERWKRRVGEVVDSSPAIGDIDGDGRLEAVVGAGVAYRTPDSSRVFAWHLDDGSDVPGWPRVAGGEVWASPSLGDVTGDGRPEVVVGSRDGMVNVWRGDGSLLWSRPPNLPGEGGGEIISSAVVADLDGDGGNDIAVGNGWGLFVLRGGDGSRLWEPPVKGWTFQNAPALARHGSGWVLVAAGMGAPGSGRVWAFDVPTPGSPPPWPMWRRNARHLGAAPSDGPPLPPGLCARPNNPPGAPSSASGRGYWLLGRDGGVHALDAPYFGNALGQPVAAIAARRQGDGYWVLMADGRVVAYGAAGHHGDVRGLPLNGPPRRIEPTPSGNGYWVLGADGGVFSFGDARFHGSTGGVRLNASVVSMAATPGGGGYWLLGADGGVFSFGDARFHGSTGGLRLAAPVISMTASPEGEGYWLLGADGGIFSFDVPYHGSVPGLALCRAPQALQVRATATGGGYWVLAADGGIFSFGDAAFHGARPDLPPSGAAVDLAVRR